MLEANFCLLGKVALAFPPPSFFFFFLARGSKALPRPGSLGWDAVRSSESLSAGYRNRDLTPILSGAERATVIVTLVRPPQGLRILGLRTRGRGPILYCCPPPEGKCLLLFWGCSGRPFFSSLTGGTAPSLGLFGGAVGVGMLRGSLRWAAGSAPAGVCVVLPQPPATWELGNWTSPLLRAASPRPEAQSFLSSSLLLPPH